MQNLTHQAKNPALERQVAFQAKFSAIAHRDHRFYSPVEASSLLALIQPLPMRRVLDLACGRGEALIQLAEQKSLTGLGVDRSATFLALAREEARRRGVDHRLHWTETDLHAWSPRQNFDLVMSIGGPFLGHGTALTFLQRHVRPAGWILLGDGYWKQTPHPAYLAGLGAQPDEFADLAGQLAIAKNLGLAPVGCHPSSLADWDAYENRYAQAMHDYLTQHPDDPDHAQMANKISNWQRLYRQWGRDTLGFALFLYRAPERQVTP